MKTSTLLIRLGALLLGCGFFLFLSQYWDGVPYFFRLGFLASGMLLIYATAAFLISRINAPRTGEALYFLGMLVFGGLLLYAANTIEGLTLSLLDLCLLWILGVLPLVFLLALPFLYYLLLFLGFFSVGIFLFFLPVKVHIIPMLLVSLGFFYLGWTLYKTDVITHS